MRGVSGRGADDADSTVVAADYLPTNVTHVYAHPVHSAQGVTAETTHAVLGETTTR
ncbi:hypothetical protein [Mycobacterium avium]|uniref:hypothetical protein n=1 Tax=Mycobacterium avium TaxID=1764 RepID=UPI000A6E5AB0|nr:hypothetical protein [Mycobacterium avium]